MVFFVSNEIYIISQLSEIKEKNDRVLRKAGTLHLLSGGGEKDTHFECRREKKRALAPFAVGGS